MTLVKFRLAEAIGFAAVAPVFFCLLHWIDGTRPFVTEFEAGAITGVVWLKLIEVLRAKFG